MTLRMVVQVVAACVISIAALITCGWLTLASMSSVPG